MGCKAKNVSTFVPLYATNLFLMKNKIVLFISGCIVLFLSSCLGGDEVNYEMSQDVQIRSFSMSHDSIPELKGLKFTIDQLNGRIFNADSLPYGTKVSTVICSIDFGYGIYSCQLMQEAKGDTVYWNKQDSINFAKPVKLVNSTFDGKITKTYVAQVNIHQVLPDSMVWVLHAEDVTGLSMQEQKVIPFGGSDAEYYYMYAQTAAGNEYKLYRSAVSDAKNWAEMSLSGLPAGQARISQITEYAGVLYVPTINGALYQSANGQNWTLVENVPSVYSLLGSITVTGQDIDKKPVPVLATIIDKEGTLTFAKYEKSVWITGDAVPSGFPVKGFSGVCFDWMYKNRLMIATGRDKDDKLLNTAWATMDGRSWALITNSDKSQFPVREGAMLAQYDGKFYLIGGINAYGGPSRDMYISEDQGVNWLRKDTLQQLPSSFKQRGFSSIHVDKKNNMLIFGGKESNSTKVLDEIWRGRLNRLVLKD